MWGWSVAIQAVVAIILFIMQQTGKTEGEIDKATLWKKARELKTGGFNPEAQVIVDKIKTSGVGRTTHENNYLLLS
ncbi:hypothetical protein L1987_87902 [Smallanthus sonchifolius]|nr:hypothetical protein L1987_87902 [Smallanthus sonchifolius]